MPCYDPRDNVREIVRTVEDPVASAALCGLMRALTKTHLLEGVLAEVDWKQVGFPCSTLDAWWADHCKKDDAKLMLEVGGTYRTADNRLVNIDSSGSGSFGPIYYGLLGGVRTAWRVDGSRDAAVSETWLVAIA